MRLIVWLVLLGAITWPVGWKLAIGKWPEPKGSMDFQDGIRLEYQMNPADLLAKGITTADARKKALDEAEDVFRSRLGEFEGKKELSVRTAGDNALIVEVAGVQDLQRVLALIGHPQVLTFRIIEPGREQPPVPPEPCFRTPGETDGLCQYVGPTIMDYSKFAYGNVHVRQVTATDTEPGGFGVVFAPKGEFRQEWLDVTRRNYGKVIAICLDDVVMEQAQDEAEEGIESEAIITGYATIDRAQEVEKLLKDGPLRVSFDNTMQRQLGRSVGPARLDTAFKVLGLGLAAVCLILFLAYSNNPQLFFVILFCQVVQASLVYFLSFQGYFALSLLSLCALGIMSGICVDNVILENEEILNQLRTEARGPRGQVGMSYARESARAAIKDEWKIIWPANILSVVAVLPLYLLGEPVTGLVVTMLAAVVFALLFVPWLLRPMLGSDWLLHGLLNGASLHPLLRLRFDLASARRDFRLLYGIAVLGAIILIPNKGLVKGIDFQLGTEIALQADGEIDQGELERAADDYFGIRCTVREENAGSVNVTSSPTYLVQVPGFGPDSASESRYAIKVDGLAAHLNSNLHAHFEQKSAVSVGATLTGMSLPKFLTYAGIGVVVSLVSISAAFCFPVAFVVVLAMLLDALVSLGALSLFNVPLSLPILSSLLAIVGYSVYDSIVVASHLREDLGKARGTTPGTVTETLRKLSRRMILTMISTALPAFGIAMFCGDVLRDFGIIMAVGSISGLVSTVAIVVPGVEFAYGERAELRDRTVVRV